MVFHWWVVLRIFLTQTAHWNVTTTCCSNKYYVPSPRLCKIVKHCLHACLIGAEENLCNVGRLVSVFTMRCRGIHHTTIHKQPTSWKLGKGWRIRQNNKLCAKSLTAHWSCSMFHVCAGAGYSARPPLGRHYLGGGPAADWRLMPHLTDLKLEEDDFRQTMTPPSPWTPSWGWRVWWVTTQTSAHKPPRYLCKCLVSPFPAECWIVLCYDTLSPHIVEPSPDRINNSQDVWPRPRTKQSKKRTVVENCE